MNVWEAEEKKRLLQTIYGRDLSELTPEQRSEFKAEWQEIEERAKHEVP